MYWKEISRILGSYLLFFAITLLVPLGIALYYEFVAPPEVHPQPHATLAFFLSLVICVAVALALRWFGRKRTGALYRREGLALVVIIWFVTAIIAALPFNLSGTLEDPCRRLF